MEILAHTEVLSERGMFCGWPANGGLWSFGGELLTAFYEGRHSSSAAGLHTIDRSTPKRMVFCRSADGGFSWTREATLLPEAGETVPACPGGLPLSDPDFALLFKYESTSAPSRSVFYASADRGGSWSGPYAVPAFCPGMSMRTSYIPCPGGLLVGMTGTKTSGIEGVSGVMRMTEGGARLEPAGMMGGELTDGFRIMPSLIKSPGGELLAFCRVANNWCAERRYSRIECWASRDGGSEWELRSTLARNDDENGGNPPAAVVCGDRIAVVYGRRKPPFGIMLALSDDLGRTWKEYPLREDAGCADMGYPRAVVMPDGRVVTVYYYNLSAESERFVAATIFRI